MVRGKIKKLLREITGKEAKVEYPANPEHGDYSTNAAMAARLNSQKIAKELGQNPMFEKVEAKSGFVNFYLAPAFLRKLVGRINLPCIGRGRKAQVEFISANPTGPLTMGNGRGAFVGDCLANILNAVGFKAQREYYINDRGAQIEGLKKGDYKGEERTAKQIQKDNQKFIAEKLKVKFDKWFSEQSLYDSGLVAQALKLLEKKKLTYEKDRALWLRTTKFGDDKDRVLVRKDGEPTYLLSDIAYFRNKMDRGFKLVINLWGADHHGYVARFKAMIRALGYREDVWLVLIMQLVRLVKGGKEFKMSKRKGVFVTLEWLVDEVGLDAARFFFLMRSANSHMDFDLDLAKERSEKNPVYYAQYAHARICSILSKFGKSQIPNKFKSNPTGSPPLRGVQQNSKFKLLEHPSELDMIKQLIKFPEILEDIASDYQTQKLPQYILDLAADFHKFYRDCRVLCEDEDLSQARLSLLLITKNILKQAFDLMGISAPEKM